jgi:hypothetical protein
MLREARVIGLDMAVRDFADPVAGDQVQVRGHGKPPFHPLQVVTTVVE